jgi:hypothetical protein
LLRLQDSLDRTHRELALALGIVGYPVFHKNCNPLDSTRSQSCTALESVHKQIACCLTFKTVTNFFFKAKSILAANSFMHGIVKVSFIGFSLDYSWTNLSVMPNNDSVLMYATAEYTSCDASTKICM